MNIFLKIFTVSTLVLISAILLSAIIVPMSVQATGITCSSNSDCGINALYGNPFCQGNDVYTNQLTYYCNNPGTSQSFCSSSLVPQLTAACGTNKICNNGSCSSQNISCGSNAECGHNGLTGNFFCQYSGVYKNYITLPATIPEPLRVSVLVRLLRNLHKPVLRTSNVLMAVV